MRAIRMLTIVAIAAAATSACRKKDPPQTTPLPTGGTPTTTPTTTRDTAAERIAREREAAERDREARRTEIERLRTTVTSMVYFDYDESAIREDARAALDRKVPILRANPSLTLRIEGHADERGSVEYNLALSLRRATAIRDYLVGFGIDASRLTVVPMGEERPLETGASEDAYARNRRGEFHILSGGDNIVSPR